MKTETDEIHTVPDIFTWITVEIEFDSIEFGLIVNVLIGSYRYFLSNWWLKQKRMRCMSM